MKKIYENYSELGELCRLGEGIFHGAIFNKHEDDSCLAWQQGIRQFAEMLDKYVEFPKNGVQIKRNI